MKKPTHRYYVRSFDFLLALIILLPCECAAMTFDHDLFPWQEKITLEENESPCFSLSFTKPKNKKKTTITAAFTNPKDAPSRLKRTCSLPEKFTLYPDSPFMVDQEHDDSESIPNLIFLSHCILLYLNPDFTSESREHGALWDFLLSSSLYMPEKTKIIIMNRTAATNPLSKAEHGIKTTIEVILPEMSAFLEARFHYEYSENTEIKSKMFVLKKQPGEMRALLVLAATRGELTTEYKPEEDLSDKPVLTIPFEEELEGGNYMDRGGIRSSRKEWQLHNYTTYRSTSPTPGCCGIFSIHR
ncbi:hypothetical protein [Spongorhabdus nitratireducens]